jgi:hypothetical protein
MLRVLWTQVLGNYVFNGLYPKSVWTDMVLLFTFLSRQMPRPLAKASKKSGCHRSWRWLDRIAHFGVFPHVDFQQFAQLNGESTAAKHLLSPPGQPAKVLR